MADKNSTALHAVGVRTMSTREIADLTGKRHDHVMASARKLAVRLGDSYASENFKKSTYKHEQNGQNYDEFILSKDAAATLAVAIKAGIQSPDSVPIFKPRAEFVFGEEIVERLFSGYTIIRQFPVFGGKYRIDWYIPELRLAIEFDEAHHASPSNAAADAARQAEIEAALNCRFLRYKAD